MKRLISKIRSNKSDSMQENRNSKSRNCIDDVFAFLKCISKVTRRPMKTFFILFEPRRKFNGFIYDFVLCKKTNKFIQNVLTFMKENYDELNIDKLFVKSNHKSQQMSLHFAFLVTRTVVLFCSRKSWLMKNLQTYSVKWES